MKKFNKNFKAGITLIQFSTEYGFRLVTEINETRNLMKVEGLEGSFQVGDVHHYTNNSNVEMYPAIADRYSHNSSTGAVYKIGSTNQIYIGNLMGKTLKQWLLCNGL